MKNCIFSTSLAYSFEIFYKKLINSSSIVQSKPFIVVVEGIDFSGKTTLAHHIQRNLLYKGYRVKLLHDPKGSKNAQVIWDTILTIQQQGADPYTIFFLFLAARNELIKQEVTKNAHAVDVIIFDRFIFSTLAYQLTHQTEYWELFLTMHRSFSGLMPDLCVYCELDFDSFQLRSQGRSKHDLFDNIAQKRFQEIQLAYDQALQLGLCPTMRLNNVQGDTFTSLINSIINFIHKPQLDEK